MDLINSKKQCHTGSFSSNHQISNIRDFSMGSGRISFSLEEFCEWFSEQYDVLKSFLFCNTIWTATLLLPWRQLPLILFAVRMYSVACSFCWRNREFSGRMLFKPGVAMFANDTLAPLAVHHGSVANTLQSQISSTRNFSELYSTHSMHLALFFRAEWRCRQRTWPSQSKGDFMLIWGRLGCISLSFQISIGGPIWLEN